MRVGVDNLVVGQLAGARLARPLVVPHLGPGGDASRGVGDDPLAHPDLARRDPAPRLAPAHAEQAAHGPVEGTSELGRDAPRFGGPGREPEGGRWGSQGAKRL